MPQKTKKTKKTKASHSAKSPFIQLTTSLYLALSPCASNFPIQGLCAEHLSPHLLSYYPPLHGVLLSYSNPRISESPDNVDDASSDVSEDAKVVYGQSINEYAVTFVWLTAEFLIFRPENGTILEGEVNVQNESVLGLMCYNYFNAGIEHDKLPSDWSWDGEQWLNGNGESVHGKMRFRVEDFEASGQENISITGSLVDV